MQPKNSVGFVSVSAFIHGAVILGLVLIPALKMIPEGNDTVEIVTEAAMPIPTTPKVAEELTAPQVKEKPVPRPEVPKEQPVEAKREEPIPKVVEKPKPSEKVAKKVEPKVGPVPVAKKSSPAKKVTTPVTPDVSEDVAKAQAEAEAFAKEQAKDMKPAAPADPAAEVLDSAAETAAAEAVAKQPEEQLPPPQTKPAVQRLSEIQPDPASAPASEAISAAPGETAGPVQGEIRSHLDLKQMGGNRPPVYPPQARRQSWQGAVTLNYYVTQQGAVKEVKVVQSSGFDDLDREAVRAISQYRYVAGQEGWTSHPVIFSLKGPATAAPSRLRTAGQGAGREGR